ncbi:hypothetical protein BJX96DRAFT_188195 [Aspergillus floccosus]
MSSVTYKNPRGRTGCLTCRIRRIKCDEARPACSRCTSTGRSCDGYELESPIIRNHAMKRKGKRPLQPQKLATDCSTSLISPNRPGLFPRLSLPEGQGFAFFRQHTAYEIPGMFKSPHWEQLVLQLSHCEPCVLHAAVAVGIMHRNSKGRCPSLQDRHMFDVGSPFAVRQYIKSINCLRKRLDGPSDSQCGQIALITSLLFISFEMLQGNRPGAMIHLQKGLRILCSSAPAFMRLEAQSGTVYFDAKPHHQSTALDLLASTFARLDFDSTMFGERSPVLTILPPASPMGPELGVLGSFSSTSEARHSLDFLANAVLRFRGELLQLAARDLETKDINGDWVFRYCTYYAHSRTVDLSSYPDLLRRQAWLKFALEKWSTAFAWLNNNLHESSLLPAILLEIQHFYMYLIVSTCRNTYEQRCDQFNDTYAHIIDMARQLIDRTNNVQGVSSPGPTFTLESGIIPSLYLIAMKCRIPKIRRDAISLLYSTRCQEGMWEGALIARFVDEVTRCEEKAARVIYGKETISTDCSIPESARFSDVVIALSETPGYGRLVCARYLHESTGELEVTERTFQLYI